MCWNLGQEDTHQHFGIPEPLVRPRGLCWGHILATLLGTRSRSGPEEPPQGHKLRAYLSAGCWQKPLFASCSSMLLLPGDQTWGRGGRKPQSPPTLSGAARVFPDRGHWQHIPEKRWCFYNSLSLWALGRQGMTRQGARGRVKHSQGGCSPKMGEGRNSHQDQRKWEYVSYPSMSLNLSQNILLLPSQSLQL